MDRNGPKVRLSRQLGIAITPKAAKIMERRPGPPGAPKGGRRRKISDYKRQLLEKQKLRAQYNVHERQMRNTFERAHRMEGNTGERVVQLLEQRLDALVLRAGFARTIYAARQFVNHGHITVDGHKVDIPSYRVQPGQSFAVRQKSFEMPAFDEARQPSATAPAYLEVDRNLLRARFTRIPELEEIPIICDVQAVVEYYNR